MPPDAREAIITAQPAYLRVVSYQSVRLSNVSLHVACLAVTVGAGSYFRCHMRNDALTAGAVS